MPRSLEAVQAELAQYTLYWQAYNPEGYKALLAERDAMLAARRRERAFVVQGKVERLLTNGRVLIMQGWLVDAVRELAGEAEVFCRVEYHHSGGWWLILTD